MKKSKWGWICSLCLVLAFSAPAFGQQKSKISDQQQAAKEAKALEERTRREQRNLELIGSVDKNDSAGISKLLADGADVNARDREGMTPLMHAALLGNQDLVDLLLSKGAKVNLADNFGVTALMQAAWAGHSQIVQALISAGADPDVKSTVEVPTLRKKGTNALMGACMNGNLEVARLLLSKDVKVNQQDGEGLTALMYTARGGYPQLGELLISRGAKLEIKDQFGRTALTVATIYGNYDMVRLLIAAGANVHVKDIHDMKPIVYASALDRGDIYKVLQAAMARKPANANGNASFRRAPQQGL